MWLHALTFDALVEVSHSGTAPSSMGAPDNVLARIHEAFPAGVATDRAAFVATLASLGAPPPLPAACEEMSCSAGVRVLRVPLRGEAGAAWNARLAPLVLFFIDAGQLIDVSDDKWELLVAVSSASGGSHLVDGFATCYRFYAHPHASRLRLSQLLVLPPRQRRGAAGALVGGVRALAGRLGCSDTTVEDPTPELQRVREVADVTAARGMPSVVAAAAAAVRAATRADAGDGRAAALSMPQSIADALRATLRCCRPQAKIVWEAMLFLAARVRRAAASTGFVPSLYLTPDITIRRSYFSS